MKNLFIDEYTDELKKEYLRCEVLAVEAEKKGDHRRAYQHRDVRDAFWTALRLYYQIVVHRRRFRFQGLYASQVLRELNEFYWNIFFKRKGKSNKTEDPGASEPTI